MNKKDISKKIDGLVAEADSLKQVHYRSPKVDLWEKRAKGFVQKNYGQDFVELFNRAFSWGQVITPGQGQQIHIKALDRAIEFLSGLKDESTLTLKEKESGKDADVLSELHPNIVSKCSSLFEKDEYVEAVEKGFKVVRDKLRELTGYETGSEAFGRGRLHIRGAAAPHVDDDFNQGAKFLTMAIDRFRNEKSHTSDGNIDNPKRAYEYLTLCSLAMHLLDNAEIIS